MIGRGHRKSRAVRLIRPGTFIVWEYVGFDISR